MFIKNKYYYCYYSIIYAAKSRVVPFDVYVEKHHIIPKSMGGNNSKENLVMLTAREHFICHLLLIKITSDDNKRKMSFALNLMMAKNKNHNRNYKITSKIYKIIKTSFSDSMKELWKDVDFRKVQSDKRKEYWSISTNRDAVSNKLKQIWENEELRNQASIRGKIIWNNPDKRADQSELLKQIHLEDPTLGKKKSHPGSLNGMYGKTHTEEVKQKLSLLRKEELTGKSYKELYGEDRAQQIKIDRSNKLKEYIKHNPGIRSGSNNGRAKSTIVISPDGTKYQVHGTLKSFCKDHNLSLGPLKNTLYTGKESKGKNLNWKIRWK